MLEGKLEDELFKFSQNKIIGKWHRKGPRRPYSAGPPTRRPPQKYTIIKFVVGSFSLESMLTEGTALDSCLDI
jgi:hypothetical protein